MEPRLDYRKFNQEPLKALFAMEQYIAGCGLDHKLVHLLKLRASQLNGCAYCIDMHSIDARAAGETEQRLYALDAWRETPFFDERERAALAWIEAVTDQRVEPPRHLVARGPRPLSGPRSSHIEGQPYKMHQDIVDWKRCLMF